ncbi:type I-C CRISPR-associated endonuclease Cas1c [Horticoccus sp. 23ND18S-11]|uniref:type I-C CRISPR-associated endonuclease Cas1c n=1 Tax=Horticoccus sp. 23ND18S-11 TaxID=3391832 RepID=UPI0039C982EE
MRRLLNTLYVTTQGAYLRKESETVVVEVEKEIRLRLPLLNLGGIICFGNVLCSPFLLGACAEAGIGVSFLTEFGRHLADVVGAPSGSVLLRRTQYRRADDPAGSAALARAFVAGKIANARHVLRRAAREKATNAMEVEAAADALGHRLRALPAATTLDVIRGIEGEAAAQYFSVLPHLITVQREAFAFGDRNRRPPLDPVNALLSYLYTLLRFDAAGALATHGLDPAVGFLHRDRPGRASLALDLMEEFRAPFADRLALTMINRQQVQPHHFRTTETGAVLLTEDGRKEVLTAWQKRKQEEVEHPFLGEKLPIGLLLHAQALLLARHLRGDLDAYPPFEWR